MPAEDAEAMAKDGDSMPAKDGDTMPAKDSDAMAAKDGDAMMAKETKVASDILNFQLESLVVKAGTTVTWTNLDGAPHTVSHRVADSDPPQTGPVFDSPRLGRDGLFSHTFSETGSFQYYCEIHPATMRATITVEAG